MCVGEEDKSLKIIRGYFSTEEKEKLKKVHYQNESLLLYSLLHLTLVSSFHIDVNFVNIKAFVHKLFFKYLCLFYHGPRSKVFFSFFSFCVCVICLYYLEKLNITFQHVTRKSVSG